MIEADLPKDLWAELHIFICRIDFLRGIKNEIPYSKWLGGMYSVWYLKVIGCLAYIYIEKQKRNKLDQTAKTGVLVG